MRGAQFSKLCAHQGASLKPMPAARSIDYATGENARHPVSEVCKVDRDLYLPICLVSSDGSA